MEITEIQKQIEESKYISYSNLKIGYDTDWILYKNQIITNNVKYGFNPPSFMKTDLKGHIHIYTREFYIIVSTEPHFKIVEKYNHFGPLPKYCSRAQWGIK
jgi:hypothetical protein